MRVWSTCRIGLLVILAWFSTSVLAADETAHDVVRVVSAQMEVLLEDYRNDKLEETDGLNQGVAQILEPVVSFPRIAASVMGGHRKTASKEQRAAFSEKFKIELIRTYAKGMVGLGKFKIEVLPPVDDVDGKRRVSVLQNAITAKGVTRIAYTMMKSRKSKKWKLTNVVLDGVNMGRTFAGQFDDAMKKSDMNLDAVIAAWGQNEKTVSE